jgi:hypothetical protein
MPDKQILVVGLHPALLKTVLHLVNGHVGWVGIGAASAEEATTLLEAKPLDLLLLTNGLGGGEEALLRATATALQPGIPIIQHYGGGSGLLEGEIRAALEYGINLRP